MGEGGAGGDDVSVDHDHGVEIEVDGRIALPQLVVARRWCIRPVSATVNTPVHAAAIWVVASSSRLSDSMTERASRLCSASLVAAAVRVPSAGTTTTSKSPVSDSGWSTDRVIDVVVVTRRFGPTMASSIGSMCGSTSPRAPSATRTMSITDATAEPKQPSSAISPIRMA